MFAPMGAMFVGLRSQPTLFLSLRGAMFAAREHSPTLCRLRTQPLNIAKKVLCLWGYDRNGFLAVCGGTTTLQSPHHRGTRRTNRTHFKALRVEALSASKGEIDVICPAQLHDCTSILNKETSVAAQPSAHRAAIHNINRIVADPPSLRDGTST